MNDKEFLEVLKNEEIKCIQKLSSIRSLIGTYGFLEEQYEVSSIKEIASSARRSVDVFSPLIPLTKQIIYVLKSLGRQCTSADIREELCRINPKLTDKQIRYNVHQHLSKLGKYPNSPVNVVFRGKGGNPSIYEYKEKLATS